MFTIYHDLIIKTPKNKIFEAFTAPNHLNNWWTLASSGEPVLESIYNLNFTDKYNWFAKVTSVTTNDSFFLSMTKSSEDWLPTTFGIELVSHEKGTLVKFSHTGWQEINAEYRNTSFCWAILLNDLKKYLEQGTVTPFEERN